MARVLLFGGSFDPIHNGHLIVSRFVAERLDVVRVVLIPSAFPPHKPNITLAPPLERLEMCRLAVADDRMFDVSDWEMGQPGPNYTLHTVQHFCEISPADTSLYWLLGMDSLVELGTWYRIGELAGACTLVTAARPGYAAPDLSALSTELTREQITHIERHILETPLIDIRATDIRANVAAGRSIHDLVPAAVEAHIRKNRLYV